MMQALQTLTRQRIHGISYKNAIMKALKLGKRAVL